MDSSTDIMPNNKVIQYWITFIGEGRAACGCLSGKTEESSVRVIICDYGYVKKYFCKCSVQRFLNLQVSKKRHAWFLLAKHWTLGG